MKRTPDIFHSNISFYLDGVSLVFKRKPKHDASIPKGQIWRKRSEGLQLTSKGSKSLPAGKRLHFLVAVSFNRGVVLAKDYDRMSGKYFTDFVGTDLIQLFNPAAKQKWFVMDNDPSQRSKAARNAIINAGATLFEIPPCSPDLNPIENLFHIVKRQLASQAMAEGIQSETLTDFKTRVHKTITQTPISVINNLLLSMLKHIDAVIKCKGLRMKYLLTYNPY